MNLLYNSSTPRNIIITYNTQSRLKLKLPHELYMASARHATSISLYSYTMQAAPHVGN